MFHAAQAVLSTKGISPRTHGGVLRALGEHFVKEGLIEEATVSYLGYGLELRQRADYGGALPVERADAETALDRSRRFLDAAEEFLSPD